MQTATVGTSHRRRATWRARLSGSESATVVLGAVLRVSAVAAAASFTLLSTRYLDPSGRGRMAFLVQGGYLLGSVALLGQERSIHAGGSGLRVEGQAPTLAIGGLAAGLATIALAGTGRPSGVSAAGLVALGVATARLAQAKMIRDRAAADLARMHVLLSAGFVSSAVLVILSGTKSALTWTVVFALSSLIPTLFTLYRAHVLAAGLRPTDRRGLATGDLGLAVAQRADRVILGATGQIHGLGIYAAAASITEIAILPATVTAQVRSKGGRPSRSLSRLGGLLGLWCVAVAAVVGPATLVMLGGDDYATGRHLWTALAVAAWAIGLTRLLSAESLRRGRFRDAGLIDGAIGVVALLGFALVVPRHGALGAAWMTAASYSIGAVLYIVAHHTRAAREAS